MARPRIEINQKQFEQLCAYQCTLAEIAGIFSCSDDTIERWCKRTYGEGFAEVFSKKRQVGLSSLRRNAWRLAEKNTAMCIFLLKNYCGLTDHVEFHDTEALDKLDEVLNVVKSEAYADVEVLPEAE